MSKNDVPGGFETQQEADDYATVWVLETAIKNFKLYKNTWSHELVASRRKDVQAAIKEADLSKSTRKRLLKEITNA